MSARTFAAIVGGLLAVVGLVALLLPVTIDRFDGSCGNGFATSRDAAYRDAGRSLASVQVYGVDRSADEPSLASACADALGERRLWAWPLLVVGAVALAGGLVIRAGSTTSTRTRTGRAPFRFADLLHLPGDDERRAR